MSARRIRVVFTNTPHCAYVFGYGSRELLTHLRGRVPVRAARQRAWATTEATARDLIALAESRGYDVEIGEAA